MRNLFLAAIAVVLVSSPLRAEDSKVNIGKINGVLASILSEVLKDNNNELGSFFTAASFVVDEAGTDLTSNDVIKAKVSSSATAAGAVWAPDVDTTLRLDLAMEANRLKRSASISLRADLESDTLAMFKFAAAKVAPDWCKPRAGAEDQDANAKAVCEQVKAIASAPDLATVFGALTKVSELYVADAKEQVRTAQKDLAAAKGEDKVWLERRLKNAKENLMFAVLVHTAMLDAYAKGKDSEQFTLKLMDLSLFTSTRVPEFELHLDKGKLDIGVRLNQNDIKDIDGYFARKGEIEKDLLKLQNQDPNTVKSAKSTIQFFLGITKEFIGKPQS